MLISVPLARKGAVDVILTPVYEENRPGTQITCWWKPNMKRQLSAIICGNYHHRCAEKYGRKIMLSRRLLTVQTPYGPVRVKMAEDNGRTVNLSPEYEDCKRLALEHKVPIKTVYAAAMAASLNTV